VTHFVAQGMTVEQAIAAAQADLKLREKIELPHAAAS
jgi:hypothetical protein